MFVAAIIVGVAIVLAIVHAWDRAKSRASLYDDEQRALELLRAAQTVFPRKRLSDSVHAYRKSLTQHVITMKRCGADCAVEQRDLILLYDEEQRLWEEEVDATGYTVKTKDGIYTTDATVRGTLKPDAEMLGEIPLTPKRRKSI